METFKIKEILFRKITSFRISCKKILFRKIADFRISWLNLFLWIFMLWCIGFWGSVVCASKYRAEPTKHTVTCSWHTPDGKAVPQLNMQFKVGENRPAGCYLKDTNHVSCQVSGVVDWPPISVVVEYEKNGMMEFADDAPNTLHCCSEFEELHSKRACNAGGLICNFGLYFKLRE